MFVQAPLRDTRRFLEAVTRAVSAADVHLVAGPDLLEPGPEFPGLQARDGYNEIPTLPLGPALAVVGRLDEESLSHVSLNRSGAALLQVHDSPKDGAMEVLAPELLPVLQDLLADGVLESDEPPADVSDLEQGLRATAPPGARVCRTHWGLAVLPANAGAAGFVLRPGTGPGEWGLLVPGSWLLVHLDPGELPLLCQALVAGRITQGRERVKSSAWIEWTRIELPDRFLRHQRGGGCLGFLGGRTGERVTYEPYA